MFQPVCQRTSQNGRGATNGNRAPECRAPAARRAIPSASSTGNTANANANAGGASSATSASKSNVDSNRRMLSLGAFVDSRTATIRLDEHAIALTHLLRMPTTPRVGFMQLLDLQ